MTLAQTLEHTAAERASSLTHLVAMFYLARGVASCVTVCVLICVVSLSSILADSASLVSQGISHGDQLFLGYDMERQVGLPGPA